MDMRREYIDDGSSFIEVVPLSIDPGYLTEFSIFGKYELNQKGVEQKYRFACLLFDTESVSKEKFYNILKSWKAVYVHKRQKNAFNDYVKNNLQFILDNDDIHIEKRAETLTSLSKGVVKEAFDANFGFKGLAPQSFKKIEKLISQAITFISNINSLKGLARLIGHDYDTHTHSIKVGWLIAIFINANQELFSLKSQTDLNKLLTQATVAGFLHDIGKVKIPKNIITKKGKLDNLELVVIQSHTAYSISLLFETNLPKPLMQSILYHHENFDGSGYPCGIKGKQIPFLASIAHIADVFDALTSRRSYKEPKTPFEALKIMTGTNPHADVLYKLETEVRENIKTPILAMVRNIDDVKQKELKEKELMDQEAAKRIEARTKLRDMGMAHCFDQEMLIRFIDTLNKSESFDLDGLLASTM